MRHRTERPAEPQGPEERRHLPHEGADATGLPTGCLPEGGADHAVTDRGDVHPTRGHRHRPDERGEQPGQHGEAVLTGSRRPELGEHRVVGEGLGEDGRGRLELGGSCCSDDGLHADSSGAR
ncbi:hypothetical protein N8D77_12445 [Curtobacterium flaccumfaciens]|uniref:hypothetical protein n=1 Tax=Curtobacterium flaccumfaciens TaxID=2035 RepID=UPI0021C8B8FA|nr:hypothetical protein [Curtobacterium flaccumfaciens]UXN23728.1 hypothetical protein N8D77_12445 [Curtobacterium flaccumfaciens pv. flaccumfaciens]